MDIAQQIYDKSLAYNNFMSFVIAIIPDLLAMAFDITIIVLLIIIIRLIKKHLQ